MLQACFMLLRRAGRSPVGRPLLQVLPCVFAHYKLSQGTSTAIAEHPAPLTAYGAGISTGPGPWAGADGGPLAQWLGDNQFATGGVILMLLGAAAATARVVVEAGVRYCWRHVMVSAEIDSRDDAYRWMMHWLASHASFKGSRAVSITTTMTAFGTSALPAAITSTSNDDMPQVNYLPAPGDHFLKYQGHWVWIRRQRATGNPQLAANARLLMETLHLHVMGRSRAPLEALLADAAAAYRCSTRSRTVVYSVDSDGYWTQVGSRPIRPLDTVVLPAGQAQDLQADCEEFLVSEEWYAHHGIPYRRGYLLYGLPGTGKTSLVMALAGALQLDIYVVTLSSPTMSDETLRGLLNAAAPRSLLLLEDVDAAFVGRSTEGASSRLTFSGLLNAIDGVAAQEGRLLFMTTNHIDRLSAALIRPGRVDRRYYFGPATREQARDLFISFYSDLPKVSLTKVGSVRERPSPEGPQAAADPALAGADASREQEGRAVGEGRGFIPGVKGPSGLVQEGQAVVQQELEQARLTERELLRLADAFAAALPAFKGGPDGSQQDGSIQQQQLAADSGAPGPVGVEGAAGGVAQGSSKACDLSMASIQGHLMTWKRDPWGAVEHASSLKGAGAGGSSESRPASRKSSMSEYGP